MYFLTNRRANLCVTTELDFLLIKCITSFANSPDGGILRLFDLIGSTLTDVRLLLFENLIDRDGKLLHFLP